MIRTRRTRLGNPDLDFEIRISDFAIEHEIRISRCNGTLELVPEETRLLIADEDDQFFFSDQMGPADVSRLQQPGF